MTDQSGILNVCWTACFEATFCDRVGWQRRVNRWTPGTRSDPTSAGSEQFDFTCPPLGLRWLDLPQQGHRRRWMQARL